MTPCERMLSLIVRAADGSLAAADQAQLNAHTASCEACRSALAAQTDVARLLGEIPFDDAPRGFAARVRARIEPRAGVLDLANWRAWTLRLAPVAAMLGVLVWLPGSSAVSATSVSAAIDAWAGGDSPQAASALVISDAVDGDDLLAWALEAPPQ